MNLVEVEYTIQRNGKYFLAYITDQALKQLHLPVAVSDEICSIAITTDDYVKVGEELCRKIAQNFTSHWQLSSGLPYIKFTGDTSKLDDLYKHHSVLIFFLGKEVDISKQYTHWQSAIRFMPNLTFIAFAETTNRSSIITRYPNVALTWLEQYASLPDKSTKPRYDLNKVMHDWYLDNSLDKLLKEEAEGVLAQFVYARKYSKQIPGFLVVPVYHYKRYEKASKILTAMFDTKFVMSLPLTHETKSYTVLFPVLKDD